MIATPSASENSPVKPRLRMEWLDALRGLAVIVMIEAHVFNSFAQPHYFEAPHFPLLSFINGLVAPCFLWIAGFLAGLSALKIQDLSDLSRRFKRCAEVYLIGALLHAPWWLWLKGDFSLESWHYFFHLNILQCMGLSLGTIYLLGFALRGLQPVVLKLTFLALTVWVVINTEWIAASLKGNPWLSLLVSESNGSLFPLLPWIAFSLAGASCSTLLWRQRWYWIVALGFGMIWLGLHLEPHPFRKVHPSFFIERLGYVLVLAVIVEQLAKWGPRSFLSRVGQSSLGYYVWHLAALYFIPWGGSVLFRRFGESLNLYQLGVLYGGILSFCVVLVTIQDRVLAMGTRRLATKKG